MRQNLSDNIGYIFTVIRTALTEVNENVTQESGWAVQWVIYILTRGKYHFYLAVSYVRFLSPNQP